MIEGQVALLADENWEAQVEAQTPSEIEVVPKVTRMLNFVLENNKFFQLLDVTSRRYLKQGVATVNVQYNPDWGDGFGLPVLRSINPAYAFPDPNITDIYEIQDGRFFIETQSKSIVWAERNFGREKASMIIPGYDPITNSTLYGENSYGSNEIQRMNYLHLHIWEKFVDEDGELKLRYVQMSGDGTILYDSFEEGDEFPTTEFPYFMAPCYYREGTIWAKGDAELLFDQQDQINDLDDQVLNNARLTGNPQKVYDPSSFPDGEDWTNGFGITLPVVGGPSSIGYLVPPSMPTYPIQKRNRIMDMDVPSITRFYPQMTGGRIKGVDTATEALSMQQAGMTGIDHKKRILAAMFSDVIEYIYKLCTYHWDEEKYFIITEGEDKNGGFMAFNPSQLAEVPVKEPSSYEFAKRFKERHPEKEMPKVQYKTDKNGKPVTKKTQLKFNFKVGAGIPKNLAFMYTVWKEDYMAQVVSKEEFRRWQREHLGMPLDLDLPQGELAGQEQQSMSMNSSGINASVGKGQPQTAQGRRTDKELQGTPSPMVQGMNSNDVVQTAGG
jgi:hypothetical protein